MLDYLPRNQYRVCVCVCVCVCVYVTADQSVCLVVVCSVQGAKTDEERSKAIVRLPQSLLYEDLTCVVCRGVMNKAAATVEVLVGLPLMACSRVM